MALNLKNREVERLASEVAAAAGETKTEAIRRALAERRQRLQRGNARRRREQAFLRYLAEEVWPSAPVGQLGRRLSRGQEDEILGCGPENV